MICAERSFGSTRSQTARTRSPRATSFRRARRRPGLRSIRWAIATPIGSRWIRTPVSSTGVRSVQTRTSTRWDADRAGTMRSIRLAAQGTTVGPTLWGTTRPITKLGCWIRSQPRAARNSIPRIQSTPHRTTPVSPRCRRRAARTSGIPTGRRRTSPSSAPGDGPPRPVPFSTARISGTRRDRFRRTTTASCSSTNSCGIGSWWSPWTRAAISCPSSGSCRARRSARRSRWNSRRAGTCTSSSTARCGSRATMTHGSCASSTTPAIASRSSQPRSITRKARCHCVSHCPQRAPWISTRTRCATSGRSRGRPAPCCVG